MPRYIDVYADGFDAVAHSDRSGVANHDPSMTVQSMAEDADINVLMKRFGVTGKMPENPRIPSYGDFTGISDFRSALDAVRLAEDSFMQIPADVRSRFSNDPQQFLEFCSQESNREEMVRLGLMKRPPVGVGPVATSVPVTEPAPPAVVPPSGAAAIGAG